MDFAVAVSESGVVEHADDVVEHLVDRDVRVFPGVYDAWCHILQDDACDLASWIVKNV